MKTLGKVAAIILPAVLATCGSNPQNCAGWNAGYLKPSTADYISKNDPEFTQWVLSHNEHGVDQRCWTRGGRSLVTPLR